MSFLLLKVDMIQRIYYYLITYSIILHLIFWGPGVRGVFARQDSLLALTVDDILEQAMEDPPSTRSIQDNKQSGKDPSSSSGTEIVPIDTGGSTRSPASGTDTTILSQPSTGAEISGDLATSEPPDSPPALIVAPRYLDEQLGSETAPTHAAPDSSTLSGTTALRTGHPSTGKNTHDLPSDQIIITVPERGLKNRHDRSLLPSTARATLASGTAISRDTNQLVDHTDLIIQTDIHLHRTDLPTSTIGSVMFGQTGQHLRFSDPVQLEIPVTGSREGSMVTVLVQHEGASGFNTEGLSTTASTDCLPDGSATLPGNTVAISGDLATIWTCGASTFIVTYTGGQTTGNFIDNGTLSKPIEVTSGQVNGGSTIQEVVISVEFWSIDGTDINNPGPLNANSSEIAMQLTSPLGTLITLLTTGTYTDLNAERVTVTFDDTASALPSLQPATGTFLPTEALSGLIGEDPLGTWTFDLIDDTIDNGVILYQVDLQIDALDCGDGLIQGTEQCDDDNTTDGDGCSSSCQIEGGRSCSGQPSSCSYLPAQNQPPTITSLTGGSTGSAVRIGETYVTTVTATDDTHNVIGQFGSRWLTGNQAAHINYDHEMCDPAIVLSHRQQVNAEPQRVGRPIDKQNSHFTVRVDNYTDSLGSGELTQLDYLIVQTGSYTISGMQLHAGSVSVPSSAVSCQSNVNAGISTQPVVNFLPTFDTDPAIIHAISTYNDTGRVISTVNGGSDRQSEPTTSSMGIHMHRSFNSCTHGSESIDRVAVEPGHRSQSGFVIDATRSSDSVQCCNSNGYTVNFDTSFPIAPATVLVSQLGEDGGNGGYAVVHDNQPVTASSFQATIDEDGPGADRTHTTEIVAGIAFSTASGLLTAPNELSYRVDGGDDGSFFEFSGSELHFIDLPNPGDPEDSNGDGIYEVEIAVCDSHCSSACDTQLISVDITQPSCYNLYQDGGELGIDCGPVCGVTCGTCGDGLIEGAETCDDGGTDAGDGCSNICRVEEYRTCTGEPSVCSSEFTINQPPEITSNSGGAVADIIWMTGTTVTTITATDESENVIGQFGQSTLQGSEISSIGLSHEMCSPAVVVSHRQQVTAEIQRLPRIIAKNYTDIDLKVDNYSMSLSTGIITDIDYMIVESGAYTISGMQLQAGSVDISSQAVSCESSPDNGLPYQTQVSFSPVFSSSPAVLHMISSYNSSSWVFSNANDGSSRTAEPTTTGMGIYMHRSFGSCSHAAEQADYIALEPGVWTHTGFTLDTFTSNENINCCSSNGTAVPFNASFSTAPPTITISQLGMDGAQGGYAMIHNNQPVTSSQFYATIDEDGPGANRGHIDEVIGVAAFSSATGLFTTPNELSYQIIGGADSGQFMLSGSDLSFITTPDPDSPTDADSDGLYEVRIQVCDSHCTNKCDTQLLRIDTDPGEVTISAATGWLITGISSESMPQIVTGNSIDYFQLTDTRGADSGYRTTLQMTDLIASGGSISVDQIEWQGSGISLLSGDTNTGVILGANFQSYTVASGAQTFIKRDPAPNSNRQGTYGTKLYLRISVPPYTRADRYESVITYTLYEN